MSGASVLVVDDETAVVEVVALYLRRDGFDVRVAHDGLAAQKAIDAEDTAAAALFVEKLWALDPTNHRNLFAAALMLDRTGARQVVLRQMQRLAPSPEIVQYFEAQEPEHRIVIQND